MLPKYTPPCSHHNLIFTPSSHAQQAGYKHPSLAQRIASANPQVTRPSAASNLEDNATTFPAPLVLPGDELSWDPTSPQQSLRSWIRGKHRNAVTPERKTVYLAAPPDFAPGLEFARAWSTPMVAGKEKVSFRAPFPETGDVLEYLKAFYHGLPVKLLPGEKLCFTDDVEDDSVVDISPSPSKRVKGNQKSTGKSKSPKEKFPTLWLNTQTSAGCVGIRTRKTPKGAFSHQLNLNDLLDAVIEILPKDAYALLLLVEHDIFEDEDDDFACGRAYGGSRIAVVSGARYDPMLDEEQRVPTQHAWPASHCRGYVENCIREAEEEGEGDKIPKKKRKQKRRTVQDEDIQMKDDNAALSPMHAALSAHLSPFPSPSSSFRDHSTLLKTLHSSLWLGRISRTASHELGHCFGIAHCVSYACVMQGTASIIEDARQPLYLCPIDLAKVLYATGMSERGWYGALLGFCQKCQDGGQLWRAFGRWIEGRVGELEGEGR